MAVNICLAALCTEDGAVSAAWNVHRVPKLLTQMKARYTQLLFHSRAPKMGQGAGVEESPYQA